MWTRARGTVGIAVDREIDHCVQDHELEELEVGDPLLDVATEVVGADDLAGAAGQFDHHGRGRQEQVVELVERAATHDVGVGVLQTTDRDVVLRLRRELTPMILVLREASERRSLRSRRSSSSTHHMSPCKEADGWRSWGCTSISGNPPAWRQDWHRLYDFTLELCEEAERLGADSVWLSEHHLFEDGYLTPSRSRTPPRIRGADPQGAHRDRGRHRPVP